MAVTKPIKVEQVEELDNDALVSVRNDHTSPVAGISPGSTGEVKYGLFKSSVGLVEV